jgi:hypothetical protein
VPKEKQAHGYDSSTYCGNRHFVEDAEGYVQKLKELPSRPRSIERLKRLEKALIRNSRTGTLHDPASIVEIAVPTILSLELFEQVQRRLSQNSPKVTAPRIVNGPTLLAGLAVCASCGAGMTRTGTRRRGRVYSYYSCGGSQQKGKSVCRGRHLSMARLDALIVDNVKEHLFGGDRLARILDALIDRQGAKDQAVEGRRSALEAEIAGREDRLKRLYRAIEEGIVDLDSDLKHRIQALKQEREVAQALSIARSFRPAPRRRSRLPGWKPSRSSCARSSTRPMFRRARLTFGR